MFSCTCTCLLKLIVGFLLYSVACCLVLRVVIETMNYVIFIDIIIMSCVQVCIVTVVMVDASCEVMWLILQVSPLQWWHGSSSMMPTGFLMELYCVFWTSDFLTLVFTHALQWMKLALDNQPGFLSMWLVSCLWICLICHSMNATCNLLSSKFCSNWEVLIVLYQWRCLCCRASILDSEHNGHTSSVC